MLASRVGLYARSRPNRAAAHANGPASFEAGPFVQCCESAPRTHWGFVTETVMSPPVTWLVTVTDTPWPATMTLPSGFDAS
jgi:hypothetical protein